MEGAAPPPPPVAEAAPSLDMAAAAPVMDVFSPAGEASDTYEGSMEWTAADQAAFEGAVVESNLGQLDIVAGEHPTETAEASGAVQAVEGTEETKTSDTPNTPNTVTAPNGVGLPEKRAHSAPAENREAAENYFDWRTATGQEPLIEDELFTTIFEDSQALGRGFWLNDLDPDNGGEVDLEVQQERQAAIKYVAAELGLAVEDVTVETGEGILMDTCIRSYTPEELPAEPVKSGDAYICEGKTLSEAEAARVMAARHWAQQAGEQALKAGLGSQVLAAVNAMGKETAYAVAITYNAPVEDTVRITAEPSEKIPQLPYEHYSAGSQDVFLAKVNSPEQPALPAIHHTSGMMGYDVDRYQYTSGTGAKDTYDAQLHT